LRRDVIGDFERFDDGTKPGGGNADVFIGNLGELEVIDTALESLDTGI
jgi:hypothetical protein